MENSMNKKRLLTGIIIILGLISAIHFGYCRKWHAVDKCLDNGGRWNYDKNTCEYTEAK